jgi:uncharacterized protein (TIGR03435 family)
MGRTTAIVALAVLLNGMAIGQTTSTPLSFEAADVHVSPPSSVPFPQFGAMGIRYVVRNATLVDLVSTAYGVESDAVIGGPAWLEKDRFEIVAKVSPHASDADRLTMLQALLADRFKLVIHKDQKTSDVYTLTAGKKVQIKASDGVGSGTCQNPDPNGPPPQGPPLIVLNCKHMTMDEFAVQFHQMAGGYVTHPMVNLTGLPGAFDFTIRWTPRGALRPPSDNDPNPGISFFDAVENQLGLKLVADKRPMPVIVVDSVNETPTENAPGVTKLLPPAPTEFEAASVKPNKSGAQMRRIQPKAGGRIEIENIPLKMLIGLAWDMDREQDRIVGVPKWADSDCFDIVAKTSDFPMNAPPPFDAVRVMLKSLLIERFKLTTHMDEQPVAVWNFVVAKGGVKMKEADPANRPNCKPSQADPTGSGTPMLQYVCQNTTMAQLVDGIRNVAGGYVDKPAVDMTGLKGGYDFTIKWTPRGALLNDGKAAEGAAADPSGGISFFDAIERQLGIKMETGKKPLPVLVIDHVEQPSEN